jgi:hypothetical protein
VGRIYINQRESLTIGELKHGLRTAIERGLQLAIFNSCDGLGLGKELENLQIPQAIVMREPVPDKVAQEFLKHFLKAFSTGKSLYLAVRIARERLAEEGLERELPGIMGLPVICQNPAATPLIWLRKKKLSILHQGKLIIGVLVLLAVLLLIPIVNRQITSYQVYDPNKERLNTAIKISYPKNWKIKYPQNWQRIPSATNTEVVKFLAPKDNSSVLFPARIIVSIEQVEDSSSLDEYTLKTVNQISQDFSKEAISPKRTRLAGLDADEIVYSQPQEDQNIKIKQVWALAPNHTYAYIITYQAEPERFAEFEETAQKIIDSFTID